MTKRIDIVAAEDGDWEGLYIDGKLAAEGHSLDTRRVVEALGFTVGWRSVDMRNGSNLPQNIDELKDADA